MTSRVQPGDGRQRGGERPPSRRRERGSALVEAAIIIPVLLLIVYWSAALTDILVLKLKASEAARFALWETTVFRTGPAIDLDVRNRFTDLRSPASLNLSYTGLMMYPQSSNMVWSAAVDTSARRVALGGTAQLPTAGVGWLTAAMNTVINFISKSVDTAVSRQRFNVYGYAEAKVSLVRASHLGSAILSGGDLLGNKGGNDLDHPGFMANFTFQTPLPGERPMRLVFDSWKAWPKPAAFTGNGAPSNTAVSPMQTYPTVEDQVSAQVKNIAFYGLTRQKWFTAIDNVFTKLTQSGIMRTLMGGTLPSVFSTAPMDKNPGNPRSGGPITILPVEPPDVSWAPGRGLKTQRLGDEGRSGGGQVTLDEHHAMSAGVDRSRYTVPYKINSQYWTADGATTSDGFGRKISAPKLAIAQQNEYVKAFACRGHYFAGSRTGQQTVLARRYQPSCGNR